MRLWSSVLLRILSWTRTTSSLSDHPQYLVMFPILYLPPDDIQLPGLASARLLLGRLSQNTAYPWFFLWVISIYQTQPCSLAIHPICLCCIQNWSLLSTEVSFPLLQKSWIKSAFNALLSSSGFSWTPFAICYIPGHLNNHGFKNMYYFCIHLS